ncbi:MAG: hypothetical protein FWG79_06080 [Bacteroidales bacterium]|nr:hypothetical protein [Bacteroidales bacterium]
MKIAFKKYHCLGRDFILLDNRDGAFDGLQHTEIARLCARRFGIGASGVLRLDQASKTLIRIKAFNFNGGLAESNAVDTACAMAFAKDLGLVTTSIHIDINEQILCCTPVSSHETMQVVNIRILDPISIKKMFQSFVMELESKFCMVPVDDVSNTDVLEKGREISYSKRFPKGANVAFYQPNQGFLEVRHYEHQSDQETYTNGFCVVGAALSHAHNNPNDKNCLVRTKGGEMQVSFVRSEEAFYNIELQVLVNVVYDGTTL